MKRTLQFVLCVALAASPNTSLASEVIDRIVATVNRGVILQSDLDSAVRYQAFLEARSLESISPQDVQTALDHLVDQQLLLNEMGGQASFAVPDSEVRASVDELRKQFFEAATDQGWQSLLGRYGLSHSEVEDRLRLQLEILRFVDLRLRPNVRVDDAAVDQFYRNEFLPKLREAGGKEVPLVEVSARIRQVLTERHIDELLGAWLHNLREQSEVREVLNVSPGHHPSNRNSGDTSASNLP